MSPLNYKNKYVLVTGCYSGIGNAVARLLLEAGARVHGIDLKQPQLPLQAYTRTDFREPESIAGLPLEGPVDALFNCAGLGPTHADEDVLKVNFFSPRALTGRVAAQMQPGSAIASIGSIGGVGWSRHLPQLLEFLAIDGVEEALAWYRQHGPLAKDAYCLSKEAIAVWTRQSAPGLIQRGIRINSTSPGATRTRMLDEIEHDLPTFSGMDVITRPIGRCSTVDEQAWPLLLLNSELCSYVNGAELAVDGGGAALAALAGSTGAAPE